MKFGKNPKFAIFCKNLQESYTCLDLSCCKNGKICVIIFSQVVFFFRLRKVTDSSFVF